MERNLLAETPITQAFSHFPDGKYDAIHSQAVQPVFESLPDHVQEWVTATVRKYDDPRDGMTHQLLAVDLGVGESVALGLLVLLHPEA